MRERLEERVHVCSLKATALCLSPRLYFQKGLVSQSSCDVWSLGQLERTEAQIADKGAGVCLHMCLHSIITYTDLSCVLRFYEEACIAVKFIDLMDTLEHRGNLPPSNVLFLKSASTPVL